MFLRRTAFSRSCLHILRHQRPFHFTASAHSAVNAAMADTANTSGVTVASLKDTLIAKLDAQHVEIEDMSGGCGQAFQAIIVSPQFDKKTTLARHRLVNSALKAEIAAIHAWTPKCYTPEQWENVLKEQQS
ncbi:BolA protein [Blastomyces dermatitidis ER-3]|uniref:BolA protein n=3 Tax=Blastomyces TaxID=229219 RepID=A0A179U737_BLAGS|nr:BolA protein [Blastomyces gilchristii SLH14081]XP_045272905.1 BolA protein [Blastomyces dermatitidis ER-3]EGE86372.1 BolA protein [Blastomyces dermatitidis ATCC 18188]EQL29186.1 BolA protein [Blastomyces dermatitidis ATCC 26199]EEQ85076.2 BolA protein [Blastomyces dermatitidis ER-3]OAT03640.1 BolA protein [Blastomyces gilchristii SLH14081]